MSSPDSREMWCLGTKLTGLRVVPEDEIAVVRQRLANARRFDRRERFIMALPMWTGLLAGFALVLDDAGEDPVLAVLAGLGLLLVASMVFGVVLAAVVPTRRGERPLAVAWGLAALLLAIGNTNLPEPMIIGLASFVGLGCFAGAGWLVLRALDRRGVPASLDAFAEDVAQGRVMVFADPAHPDAPTYEIWPTTQFFHRASGEVFDGWTRAPIEYVAPSAHNAMDAPAQGVSFEGYRIRRRWLTQAEKLELEEVRRKMLPKILPAVITASVGAGYVGALIGQALKLPVLGGVGAFLGCGVALFRIARLERQRRRLAADLEEGFVYRLWTEATPTDSDIPPAAETLAVSGSIWTQQGRPAPWRAGRWW